MFGFGGAELLLVLVLVLIFFGAGKLPEIGSALGRSVRSFRSAAPRREIDITPARPESRVDNERN